MGFPWNHFLLGLFLLVLTTSITPIVRAGREDDEETTPLILEISEGYKIHLPIPIYHAVTLRPRGQPHPSSPSSSDASRPRQLLLPKLSSCSSLHGPDCLMFSEPWRHQVRIRNQELETPEMKFEETKRRLMKELDLIVKDYLARQKHGHKLRSDQTPPGGTVFDANTQDKGARMEERRARTEDTEELEDGNVSKASVIREEIFDVIREIDSTLPRLRPEQMTNLDDISEEYKFIFEAKLREILGFEVPVVVWDLELAEESRRRGHEPIPVLGGDLYVLLLEELKISREEFEFLISEMFDVELTILDDMPLPSFVSKEMNDQTIPKEEPQRQERLQKEARQTEQPKDQRQEQQKKTTQRRKMIVKN